MSRRPLLALVVLLSLASSAQGAPSAQQLCESAMELASAKYAQCRLTAQSKDAKVPNPPKLTEDLAKCSRKLSDAFSRASLRYGAACAATEPSSAFDAYLKQCSDDTTAAAAGAALPDYVGDLASCNADLSTCNGDLTGCNGSLTGCQNDLSTCTANLATTTSDLASCEGDLAACQTLPPARLLTTGQTTSFGAGSDGDVRAGIAQGYVDNGDGTITDTSTGLMWEKKSDDGSIHDKDNVYTWSGASFGGTNMMDGTVVTFLATLNDGGGFAGHTDWRLPNRRELESLIDLGSYSPAVVAAFNTNCGAYSSGNPGCTVTACSCANPNPNNYWSSSSYLGFPQHAWVVSFNVGSVDDDQKSGNHFVRAVRGGL